MKVRSQVFETNSSSSHSLVLSETITEMIEPPIPESAVKAGVYEIYPNDFGWEIESYTDVQNKASYLYADACMGESGDYDPNDQITRTENDKLKMIEEAFRRHAGVNVIFQKGHHDYDTFGSIDHQSVGLCSDVWDEGVNGVIRFLFSQKSVLITDNDNH